METRKLGRTGEMLSIVGFGGILVMNEEPAKAAELVAYAVEERGVNYFDIAPTYGNAEERLGPALEPYRDRVFLACKTGKRTAAEASTQLQESLDRLRTDHFDLYQLHGVVTLEEVDTITGPGGALETFIQAREDGLIRYIGFSAHTEEAALALMDHFPFDSVLFPFNWVSWHQNHFGPRVLAKAQELGMGILALKALADGKWKEGEERTWSKTWYSPVQSFDEASLALRFTLSKPITAALTPGHEQFFRWACDIADKFTPLSPEEMQQAEQRSQQYDPIFPQQH